MKQEALATIPADPLTCVLAALRWEPQQAALPVCRALAALPLVLRWVMRLCDLLIPLVAAADLTLPHN